jgi:hypothetical protein
MPSAQSAFVAQAPGTHSLISTGGGQSITGQSVPGGHVGVAQPALAPVTWHV